ncbi:MAG: hypothetical protein AVDCRST_MAG36-2926, partial [uncultured Nocardioidaceae bacterium]
ARGVDTRASPPPLAGRHDPCQPGVRGKGLSGVVLRRRRGEPM